MYQVNMPIRTLDQCRVLLVKAEESRRAEIRRTQWDAFGFGCVCGLVLAFFCFAAGYWLAG